MPQLPNILQCPSWLLEASTQRGIFGCATTFETKEDIDMHRVVFLLLSFLAVEVACAKRKTHRRVSFLRT
jgi:hypothetical protein